jgi:hypothetical protein
VSGSKPVHVIHSALQFGFIFIVPVFIQNTHEDGIWMNVVHYTCQKDINVFIRDQINYIFVKTEHTYYITLQLSHGLAVQTTRLQFLARGGVFLISTMPRANQSMQPHIHWITGAAVV